MGHMRILIVDDSEQMRRTIRSLLGDLVEEAFEACDGAEALARVRACRPDWVLMDVRMKGMDGIRATRLLKSDFPGTNVLIMTSFDDPGAHKVTAAAGASAVVLNDDLLAIPCVRSARRGPGE